MAYPNGNQLPFGYNAAGNSTNGNFVGAFPLAGDANNNNMRPANAYGMTPAGMPAYGGAYNAPPQHISMGGAPFGAPMPYGTAPMGMPAYGGAHNAPPQQFPMAPAHLYAPMPSAQPSRAENRAACSRMLQQIAAGRAFPRPQGLQEQLPAAPVFAPNYGNNGAVRMAPPFPAAVHTAPVPAAQVAPHAEFVDLTMDDDAPSMSVTQHAGTKRQVADTASANFATPAKKPRYTRFPGPAPLPSPPASAPVVQLPPAISLATPSPDEVLPPTPTPTPAPRKKRADPHNLLGSIHYTFVGGKPENQFAPKADKAEEVARPVYESGYKPKFAKKAKKAKTAPTPERSRTPELPAEPVEPAVTADSEEDADGETDDEFTAQLSAELEAAAAEDAAMEIEDVISFDDDGNVIVDPKTGEPVFRSRRAIEEEKAAAENAPASELVDELIAQLPPAPVEPEVDYSLLPRPSPAELRKGIALAKKGISTREQRSPQKKPAAPKKAAKPRKAPAKKVAALKKAAAAEKPLPDDEDLEAQLQQAFDSDEVEPAVATENDLAAQVNAALEAGDEDAAVALMAQASSIQEPPSSDDEDEEDEEERQRFAAHASIVRDLKAQAGNIITERQLDAAYEACHKAWCDADQPGDGPLWDRLFWLKNEWKERTDEKYEVSEDES